jgi:hypothetical protein
MNFETIVFIFAIFLLRVIFPKFLLIHVRMTRDPKYNPAN